MKKSRRKKKEGKRIEEGDVRSRIEEEMRLGKNRSERGKERVGKLRQGRKEIKNDKKKTKG